ncbi:acetyl esterase [Seonamhaeicola sp. S2-3]|uniref:alpha/beta hydrolase n=1 Tax=Seonamhaeicola sp. S2-3 TaxID=1936081 RepID=UPI000972AE03|nr:alpha/beta hydrolase-fold protein [Seonamhaeicola sp. S2-3]APY11558.1 acetyl esterase [Seonamhaeicola sp. S2-3]
MASKFRTITISKPEYESNNVRQITVKSNHLKGRGDISVYVPQGSNYKNLPMVILLHGVYGSHNSWIHYAGIHFKMNKWIAEDKLKPMVLVMPSDGLWGDGSGYIPHSNNNFEKWITEDTVDAVIECVPQVSTQSDLFLTGLSMGGFAALRLGAKYSNKFKAFTGLSSITHLNQMKLFIEENIYQLQQENKQEESVLETLIKYKQTLSPFRFDCGTDDGLINENRKLHEALEQENIPHIYNEYPGAHNWKYWEVHIFNTLNFFNNI